MTACETVRLSKSCVGEREAAALAEVIRDGRLGIGSFVEAFERDLATYIGGNRHVVCVNTGTAALHLALEACGIGRGDEVLVPTITFVACFQAVAAAGGTPVACDVRAEDCCIDPADAVRRITPRTKAVLPVHYAGGPGPLGAIYRMAREHGLRVIEDAAHAFGGVWQEQRVGATGDVVCFSFDGIKNITSGEGGAVVTPDAQVAERVRDARLVGVEKDTQKRYAGQRSWDFDVTRQGWRYHMSNLNAAIGRVQLRRLDSEFAPVRRKLARRYSDLLSGVRGVRHLGLDYECVLPHIFPVFIDDGKRDRVRRYLLDAGIEAGIHYKPNHLLSYFGGGSPSLPVAEALYEEMLTLPLHVELDMASQDRVVETLIGALRSS